MMNLNGDDIERITIGDDAVTVVYHNGETLEANAWDVIEEARRQGDTGLADAIAHGMAYQSIIDALEDD
jgi:hypothetical protein